MSIRLLFPIPAWACAYNGSMSRCRQDGNERVLGRACSMGFTLHEILRTLASLGAGEEAACRGQPAAVYTANTQAS